jgi:Uri superfamily endonuclease
VFLKTGKLHHKLKDKTTTETYINICRTLEMKWQLNEECMERFEDEHPENKKVNVIFKKVINKKYKDIKYTLIVDMPVMCIENMKKFNMFNGTITKIEDINDDTITTNGLIFTINDFVKKFEPLFAQTIYKYQGSTINEPYCIHELDIMTKRELYTSLSRGKTIDNIHFDFSYDKYTNPDTSRPNEKRIKVVNDSDDKFKNGKIYKITFSEYQYIGSTYRTLAERFDDHITATDKKGSDFIEHLRQYKDTAKIELIKNYPCNNLNELVQEEQIYIHQALEDDTKICLNTMMTKTKSKVKNTEVKMERLEIINIMKKDEINIIEYAHKQMYRFKTKDKDGKIKDVKVRWNGKVTQEEAFEEIQRRKLLLIN